MKYPPYAAGFSEVTNNGWALGYQGVWDGQHLFTAGLGGNDLPHQLNEQGWCLIGYNVPGGNSLWHDRKTTSLASLLVGTPWEHQLQQPFAKYLSSQNAADQRMYMVGTVTDDGRADELVTWVGTPTPASPGNAGAYTWQPWRMQLPAGMHLTPDDLWHVNSSGVIAAIGNAGTGDYHALLLVPVEIRDLKDLDNPSDDAWIKPLDGPLDTNPATVAWIAPHKKEQDEQPTAYDPGDDPRMPQLAVRLKGLPASVQVQWTFDCKYARPNGRVIAEDEVKLPADGGFKVVAGDQPWNIYQEYNGQPFFGGDATLTYQVVAPDGNVLIPATTVSFRIAGKNPDNTRARLYLNASQPDLWYIYAIGKHETAEFRYHGSSYNQFVGNPAGKTLVYTKYNNRRFTFKCGEPTWNWDYSDSTPGGFGLLQVTGWQGAELGDVPRDVIWNWKRNMIEGANEIRRDKVPGATRYFNAVRSKYGTGVPDAPMVKTDGSRNLTGFEADVIVRYNGVKGTDPHPNLVPWLGPYTQDPWTYSNGQWIGPKRNSENYLNQILPEFE